MKTYLIYFINLINIINLVKCFEFSYSKFNNLLYEKEIKNCFENLFDNKSIINEKINKNKNENINNIKIVNNKNENINWFLDLLDIYCKNENINYNKISFYNFFKDEYITKDYNIIDDFMIDYGRTLSHFEKKKINIINSKNINLKKNSNFLLHIQDYDNLIIKDNEFVEKFEKIDFPEINLRLINNYIMNMVQYYNYHNDILLINWKKHDLKKMNMRNIENLIFKMHNLMILSEKNNKNFNIEYYENFLNKELEYLKLKYYDK